MLEFAQFYWQIIKKAFTYSVTIASIIALLFGISKNQKTS